MAQAAASGAGVEPTVSVHLKHAADTHAADVLAADGFVFSTPENLAGMSGQLKDFFDRTYYAVLDRLAGRPYALLVCAGSDGYNAVRQIERIVTGWRLTAMAEPVVVCTHAQTPEEILRPKILAAQDLQRCEMVGGTLAAGMALGVF